MLGSPSRTSPSYRSAFPASWRGSPTGHVIDRADKGSADVRRLAESWIDQRALRTLVEADGGIWPEGSPLQRAAVLEQFSERWDLRSGTERLDARKRAPRENDALLGRAAKTMGLMDASRPACSDYDHVLVLGGTVRSSLCRLHYADQLIANGLNAGRVVCLTTDRPVGHNEMVPQDRPPIPTRVLRASSEYEVLLAAAESLACAGRGQSVKFSIDVLSAGSSSARRRANTVDTLRMYAPRVTDGQSILLITNAQYVAYQLFAAVAALGSAHCLRIEAVGFPPEWMSDEPLELGTVLQEVRSTLRLAHELLAQSGTRAG